MKTTAKYLLALVVTISISFYSCNKTEEIVDEAASEDTSFLELKSSLKKESSVSAGKALTLEEILDNTTVNIYINSTGPEGDLPIIESAYGDLPELIELPGSGDYRILLFNEIPFEFDILPISLESKFDNGSYAFEGNFSVSSGATATINAELQLMDVAVTIDFSDELLTNYPTIEVDANITGSINVPTLTWMAADDNRKGYFDSSAIIETPSRTILQYSGDLNITIRAQEDDGTEQMVTKTYPNANPNEHYIITVSYATSTATINVTLGDEVIIEDEIPFPG